MYAVAASRTQAGIAQRRMLSVEAVKAQEAQEQAALMARVSAFHNAVQERSRAIIEKQAWPVIVHDTRPTVARLVRQAAKLFKMKPSAITGTRRNREIVFARQFVMYWACRLTKSSYPQIGRALGGRDHTTVLHGRNAYVTKRKAMGRTLRPVR